MCAKALMVLGTASHVGKSITVAALCRILHQDGFNVAPFKAQNMALNSFPTSEGLEIGRAQAVQAEAASLDPHVDMNPILLKPSSDTGSQVVLNGKVFGHITAENYHELRTQLFGEVQAAYNRLSAKHDFIIIEGAGSPVEMNLKHSDIVNLKMAEAADAACVLVADIDRGGVFASLLGTYELLTEDERARFGGFIINKFRGDISLLHDGVTYLEDRLRQTCLGVIPYYHDLKIDEEDSVTLDKSSDPDAKRFTTSGNETDTLRIGVVQLPHMSNYTDFNVLEASPGVSLFYLQIPQHVANADVLILPGTKNTIGDLNWLRATGWDSVIVGHARAGKPVIGICGGFQMLGKRVNDPLHVESNLESLAGLGLLDVETTMGKEKVTRQASAKLIDARSFCETDCISDETVFTGYEIHMGETILGAETRPFLSLRRLGENETINDGAIGQDGQVIGTYMHGLFDSESGLRIMLSHLRKLSGRTQRSDEISSYDRERHFNDLADHFRRHLNMQTIYKLLGIII